MRRIIFVLAASAIASGCIASPDREVTYQACSLVQLIANPEAFDGKRVAVAGFGVFQFEEAFVYLSSEDAQYMVVENAVRIERRDANESGANLNRRFVNVQGVFERRTGAESLSYAGVIRAATVFPRRQRESQP